MKRLLTFCLCVCFALPAYAVDYDTVSAFMENLKDRNVAVTQTKYIKSINKSFKTLGKIQFEKNVGFVYQYDGQEFVSTKEYYCINGERKQLSELPYFAYIRKTVDDCLEGKFRSLKKSFEVDYSDVLTLVPKVGEMRDFIEKIQLKMDARDIEQMRIFYLNGDYMILDFEPILEKITDEIKC